MRKDTRRGYTTEDEKLFTGIQYEKLCKAASELEYLLNAGYPIKPASTFIGNHYMFTERQRLAITRAVCSKDSLKLRQNKLVKDSENLEEVNIDGFNTVITLEVALSNSPLLRCMDQTIRDLAGLRGTYRIIDKTETALQAILQWLDGKKIKKANIYLDAPVSNSGRLKTLFYEIGKMYEVDLNVEVMNEVDQVLERKEAVITSDAIILEHCKSWVNMNAEIIKMFCSENWIVDFCKLGNLS